MVTIAQIHVDEEGKYEMESDERNEAGRTMHESLMKNALEPSHFVETSTLGCTCRRFKRVRCNEEWCDLRGRVETEGSRL